MLRIRPHALVASLLLGGGLLGQAPPPPPPPPPPASVEAPAPPTLPGVTRTERRNEPLAFQSKLWVKNRNGGIRVVGWDKEEVALVAEIRDSDRRKVDVVVRRRGADLDIEAVFQQPSWSFGFVQSPRCEMSLSVPRKILGYFRTTNGPVVVGELDGYARCETTNGDVRVKEVAGEVHAETTNGTLDVRNLKARFRGETTNGRILLEDVDGGVVAETTNGSIRARNLDGWGEGILLETTNGSIEVELGRATGELRAANSNGSLDIRLPGAEVVELSKHSAHLRIPGKAQRIVLETTNGSIRVK